METKNGSTKDYVHHFALFDMHRLKFKYLQTLREMRVTCRMAWQAMITVFHVTRTVTIEEKFNIGNDIESHACTNVPRTTSKRMKT